MPKYMIIRGGITPGYKIDDATPDDVMAKYVAWSQSLRDDGRYVSAHKLRAGEGRRLVQREGRIIDGPFAESKESIGGYYVIEAGNLDEATEVARTWPWFAVQDGFVEVRPIEI